MQHKRGSTGNFFAFCAIVGVGLAVATSVIASDGVIEINQARALAGGVTPGDTPGFPVTISVPGSYRLTSNLDVTVAADPKNTDAVDVNADNVTIDLNGFMILGPAVCTGSPVTSCTNTGNGSGVASGGPQNLAVRNGTIRGMGKYGIVSIGTGTYERLRAESNGLEGISLAVGLVVNCEATSNGSNGIEVLDDGVIAGSIAFHNKGHGIIAQSATISGNTANTNGGSGIWVENGTISNNTAQSNTSYGITVFLGAGYLGNVLTNNNGGGAQVSGGHNLGQNLCNAALCP